MDAEKWREAIRRLSLEEFTQLKELVWDESRAREAQHLADLRRGDWVEFHDRHGKARRGVVTRINSKSVSVECEPEEGHNHPSVWRVAPSLLRRLLPAEVVSPVLPGGYEVRDR